MVDIEDLFKFDPDLAEQPVMRAKPRIKISKKK
jgi:threonylcarbamoyladenosine tRNA methylthiotransferase CDKAL1